MWPGNGFGKGGMGGMGAKGGGKDKGKGKGAQRVATGEKPSCGQVRVFIAEKGCGFIANCEDVPGQDIYAHKDILEKYGAGPGDTVAFFTHWSQQGQPQAGHPLCRIGCPEGSGEFALKGTFKPGPAHPAGHGFITCTVTKEFFGRDVYVNKSLAPTLTEGQVLAFNCHLNADGMPNVLDLQVADDSWEPTPGDLSQTVEAFKKDKGSGKGKDKGGKGGNMMGMMGMMQQMMGMNPMMQQMGAKMGMNPMMQQMGKGWGGGKGDMKGGKAGAKPAGKPPPSTGESYAGFVKSFNPEKNYGFIACEQTMELYGCDVFTHGSQLADKEIGSMVYFEVGLNREGKPQGLNVQGVNGGKGGGYSPY